MFNYTFCWSHSCSTFPASIENWCAECSSSSKNLGCTAINVFWANYDLHESSTLVICGSNVVVTSGENSSSCAKKLNQPKLSTFSFLLQGYILFFFIISITNKNMPATTGSVLLAPSPSAEYDMMYYLKGAAAGGICCSITHGALTPVDVVKVSSF